MDRLSLKWYLTIAPQIIIQIALRLRLTDLWSINIVFRYNYRLYHKFIIDSNPYSQVHSTSILSKYTTTLCHAMAWTVRVTELNEHSNTIC